VGATSTKVHFANETVVVHSGSASDDDWDEDLEDVDVKSASTAARVPSGLVPSDTPSAKFKTDDSDSGEDLDSIDDSTDDERKASDVLLSEIGCDDGGGELQNTGKVSWSAMYKVPGAVGGFLSVTLGTIFALRPVALHSLNIYEFRAFCLVKPRALEDLDQYAQVLQLGDNELADDHQKILFIYEWANRRRYNARRGIEDNTLPNQKQVGGRNDNISWRFPANHPLYETHVVTLSSLQKTIVLGGMRPPRFPPHYPIDEQSPDYIRDVIKWRKEADSFAQYFMCLLKPWHVDHQTPWPTFVWEDFCEWVNDVDAEDSFIGRSRMSIMFNIVHGFLSNAVGASSSETARALLFSKWRFQNADRWNDNPGLEAMLKSARRGTKAFSKEDAKLRKQIGLGGVKSGPDGHAVRSAALFKMLISSTQRTLDKLNSCIDDKPFPVHVTASCDEDDAFRMLFVTQHTTAVDATFRATPALQSIPPVSPPQDPPASPHGEENTDPGPTPPVAPKSVPWAYQPVEGHVPISRKQASLVEEVYVYFDNLRSITNTNDEFPVPNIFLTGGPGCGKTACIKAVLHMLATEFKVLDYRSFFSAFTGSAACNLDGGFTLNSLFNLSVEEAGKSPNRLTPIHDDFRTEFLKTWGGERLKLLVIDEISLINPIFLAQIEARLQDLFGNQKPFGGVLVLLVGDLAQIGGVGHTFFDVRLSLEGINTRHEDLVRLDLAHMTAE
jgi:hypothetical protein